MLDGTHKAIMETACDFLLIPDNIKKDLAVSCLIPDNVDGLMRGEGFTNHILIPVPGGFIGSANKEIVKLLDEASKTEKTGIRITNVGKASHYLADISQPFHTSLYSVYRQGYHDIVEKDINDNLKEWIPEYAPHPSKISNINKFIENTAKCSQDLSNQLLLSFAKHEILGGEYPDDLEEQALFNAIDNQIAFLQYCKANKILDW
jgi:hypothetical protein